MLILNSKYHFTTAYPNTLYVLLLVQNKKETLYVLLLVKNKNELEVFRILCIIIFFFCYHSNPI